MLPSTVRRDREVPQWTSSRDGGLPLNEETGEDYSVVPPWRGAHHLAQLSANVVLPREIGASVRMVDMNDSIGQRLLLRVPILIR